MHSDHLGSVSTVTNQAGEVVSTQQFDPWGKVRSGGISVTKLNYTGQRKDDTGLLYYHSRYYDPSLARFVSPDSIVPGASSGVGGAGGTVGNWQNSKLTVVFHVNGFATEAVKENDLTLQKGFWF
jgi:RHS repeat-associated protein